MQHRSVEGQPRRNVTSQNAIDDAVRRRQRKWSVTGRLARRRKDTIRCSSRSVPKSGQGQQQYLRVPHRYFDRHAGIASRSLLPPHGLETSAEQPSQISPVTSQAKSDVHASPATVHRSCADPSSIETQEAPVCRFHQCSRTAPPPSRSPHSHHN
jgi:hypothetical protein